MILATAQQFVDSLEHITGFVIVLISLGVLWGVTVLIGKQFRPPASPAAVAAAAKAPAAAAAVAPDSGAAGPSDEEVAVIIAAVAAMLQEGQRVVSIRSINPTWAKEGLREHFASHRFR